MAWLLIWDFSRSSGAVHHNPPPRPVLAAVVRPRDLAYELRALGTVTPLVSVFVQAQADGQIAEVLFREGQTVRKNDRLFHLDSRTYEAESNQAAADLARGRAQLESAALDLRRIRGMPARQYVSQKDRDTQEAQVASLEASVQAAEARLQAAQIKLDFTTIRAPVDGRIGKRLIDVGNVVRAADGSHLAQIVQMDPIAVEFSIPQDSLPKVLALSRQRSLSVEIRPSSSDSPIADGKLVLIDDVIDPKSGTILLKAQFPNPAGLLWPGQFVNVRMKLDELKSVLVVPQAAIQRGPDGALVFVVRPDSTVAFRRVQTGLQSGGLIAIDSGLVEGERVVVGGLDGLAQGARVAATAMPPSAP